MEMLAGALDAAVGGDTHRDTHALEMVTPSGTTIATLSVTNDDAGFAEAAAWITAHAPGPRVAAGIEGTRSYGIGLARALTAAGFTVLEAAPPRRGERRRGKTDPGDARLAALQVLRMPAAQLTQPRRDGNREALRILLSARRELVTARTAQACRLRALLLTGTDADRGLARGRLTPARLQAITLRRSRPGDTTEQAVRCGEAHRLATAIHAGTAELATNHAQLLTLVTATAPALLDKTGVGPVSAAQAIVSWSHHGRCRNDAAYAALAGASPIPASSGRTTRHRLNRGGDRQLNKALHDILLTRWRIDPATHAYIARRRADGKNDNEIRRILKRYIARELYRTLETTPAP